MRNIVIGLACIAGAGLAVPAAAEVRAQDPASVVAALQQAGYRAQLTTDDVDDPMIRSATGGTNFSVFFYNCTDHADCRTIQFHSGYSEPENATLETVNAWNRDNRFGRAYIDEYGAAHLDMDIDLDDGGISQELFEDNIEFWNEVLGRFEKSIGY